MYLKGSHSKSCAQPSISVQSKDMKKDPLQSTEPKPTITGKVIHGMKLGRKLGFPTANLDRRSYGKTTPVFPFGIYGGHAQIGTKAKLYPAAIVIGPFDSKGLPKLEVHILDFKADLYGEKVTAWPDIFIREFKEYTSEQKLIQDIQNDIKIIRKKLKLQ